MGLRNKLNKRYFSMHSHSFQDIELKIHRYVNDFPGQVTDGLTILRYPSWLRYEGLITQKTLFQHAFAQFSRYKVENSQVRQRLSGTGQR